MKNKEEEPCVGRAGERQELEKQPDFSPDTKTQDWRLRKCCQAQGQNKQGDCFKSSNNHSHPPSPSKDSFLEKLLQQ